ncbi:hypothetical protein P152DRAFT_500251 [Eremomyces bilateralis CBS 781.70]|uniref:Uncharacterized protein n=1 Tax=Eremomyces bilateralis CBS 781.70 TaxID=1392243 RepID=A0A6G1G8S4_9PEZI|nr:uncharacterized protein P152DRAFT_500251 [Eremomyces bilateralis CBS 781.70]KAF1814444.1 hypothetical protein P152DRAFT_500251 [Eremomyces bilateralis CBS 781.70]
MIKTARPAKSAGNGGSSNTNPPATLPTPLTAWATGKRPVEDVAEQSDPNVQQSNAEVVEKVVVSLLDDSDNDEEFAPEDSDLEKVVISLLDDSYNDKEFALEDSDVSDLEDDKVDHESPEENTTASASTAPVTPPPPPNGTTSSQIPIGFYDLESSTWTGVEFGPAQVDMSDITQAQKDMSIDRLRNAWLLIFSTIRSLLNGTRRLYTFDQKHPFLHRWGNWFRLIPVDVFMRETLGRIPLETQVVLGKPDLTVQDL